MAIIAGRLYVHPFIAPVVVGEHVKGGIGCLSIIRPPSLGRRRIADHHIDVGLLCVSIAAWALC